MVGGTCDVPVFVELGAYREGGLGQCVVVASEEFAAGAEEAAVAGDGAEGGGGRHQCKSRSRSRK